MPTREPLDDVGLPRRTTLVVKVEVEVEVEVAVVGGPDASDGGRRMQRTLPALHPVATIALRAR